MRSSSYFYFRGIFTEAISTDFSVGEICGFWIALANFRAFLGQGFLIF